MNKGFLKTGFAGVAVLLTILVVFAGLFAVFTLYEREIDSALQKFESAVLDNENATPNEIVAEAADYNYSDLGIESYIGNHDYDSWDTNEVKDFGTKSLDSRLLYAALGGALQVTLRMNVTNAVDGNYTSYGEVYYYNKSGGYTRLIRLAASSGYKGGLSTTATIPKDSINTSSLILQFKSDGNTRTWTTYTCDYYFTISKTESTAPTIASSISSGSYTTSSSVTISDTGAGLYSYSSTYLPVSGGSTSNGPSATFSSSRTPSATFNFSNPGRYVITAVDNVGNSSSKTIYYYNVSLSTETVTYDGGGISSTAGGRVYLNDGAANNTVNNLTAGNTVTVEVETNPGYYFAGFAFSYSSSEPAIISPRNLSSGGSCTYTITYENPDNPHKVTAYFCTFEVSPPSGAVYLSGRTYSAIAKNTGYPSSNTFPLGSTVSNFTYSYSGTLLSGTDYSSSDAPTYAGDYTVVANAYSKATDGVWLGTTAEATFTISQQTLYPVPVFHEITKPYDGNDEFKIDNWSLYTNSANNTPSSAFDADGMGVSQTNNKYSTGNKNQGNYTFSTTGEAHGLSLTSSNNDAKASYVLYDGDITYFLASGSDTVYGSSGRLTISARSGVSVTIFIAEKTQDGTVQKYAGKVYDGTNAIGNVTTIFTYDGTAEDALTQFGNANPANGELGIGISVTNLVTEETYAFAYNGMTAGASNADLTVTLGALPYYSNPNYYNDEAVSASLADDAVSFNTSNYYYSASNLTLPSMTIYQRSVTVVVEAKDKTYDGTKKAEYNYSIEGAVAGEDVTLDTSDTSRVTAEFDSADAGTGKTVTVEGYELASKWRNNYYISNDTATDTADIDKCDVSWEVSYKGRVTNPEDGSQVSGKVYDGTTTVDTRNLTFTITGAVGKETQKDVIPTYTAVYSSANAGTVSITVTGTKFSSNYEFEDESFKINGLTIVKKDIADNDLDFTFELTETEFTYNGAVQAPGIQTARDDDINADVTYSAVIPTDSVDAKEYSVTITGTGNYLGTVTRKYSILKGDFNIDLDAEAAITLPYGVALDINSVGEAENAAYFYDAYAYTVKGSRIEGGAWEFVIGDIYNERGNTSLYRAGTHNIEVKYTLPESVAANYDVTEKTVGVALHVEQGKLSITILTEQMTFGTPYSLGAVRDVDYTIEGFVAGDDGNLTGVAFELIDGTDNGFVAANDTLNAVREYKGVIALSASYSSYNNNYTVEYAHGDVVISKLPVTVNPNEGQAKYYGESDPVFTYTATTTAALKAGYSIDYAEFAGNVSRNDGETAGTYAYVNELTSTNYDITFVRGNSVFEIYKLPVTVVPENYFAYYGEAIPAPSEYYAVIDTKAFDVTYTLENGILTVSGMENVLSITFNTLASQNASAGEYPITITQASSSANGAQNLDLSLGQGTYTIKRLPVTITPNSVSKTYGSNDPSGTNYTWAVTEGVTEGYTITLRAGFIPSFSGSIVRGTGENVGTYAWSQGTLYSDVNYNGNYDISFNGASGNAFTITPRGIMIDAVRLSITVGDPTPAELGQYTLNANSSLYDASWTYSPKPTLQEALQGGLVISKPAYNDDGTLAVKRDENENVVGYDLVPDETLASYYLPNGVTEGYSDNYYISAIVGATGAMYVGQLVAYISYNGPATFVFGTSVYDINDKIARAFTAVDNTAAANTVDIDMIAGNIAIAFSEGTYPTVGYYSVDIFSELSSGNYDIQPAEGGVSDVIEITKLDVKVCIDDTTAASFTSVYGEPDAEIKVTGYQTLVPGFDVTGQPSREAGSTAGRYLITLGTLENANYTLSFDKEYFYEVTPRPITVVPNATGHVYGQSAATITYSTHYAGDSDKEGLLAGDSLSGALSRVDADILDVGSYAITIGTLNQSSLTKDNNYEVGLDTAKKYYTISKATVTVFANPVSRVFGDAKENALSLTYTASGLVYGDSLAGSLTLPGAGYDGNGYLVPGTYTIDRGSLFHINYDIVYNSASYIVDRRPLTYYIEYKGFSYGEFEYIDGTALDTAAYGLTAVVSGAVDGYTFSPEIRLDLGGSEDGVLHAGTYQYIYYYEGVGYRNGQTVLTDVYRVSIGNVTGELVISPAVLRLAFEADGNVYIPGASTGEAPTAELNYSGSAAEINALLIDSNGDETNIGFTASLTYQIYLNGRWSAVSGMIDAGSYRVIGRVDPLSNSDYQVTGKGSNVMDTLLYVNIDRYRLIVDAAAMLEGKLTKVYGSADPALEAEYAGLNGENIAITFYRVEGEDVGRYAVNSAELDSAFTHNYSVTVGTAAQFVITKYSIEVNAEELLAGRLEKVYGSPDPEFTAYVAGVNGETVAIAFERAPDEEDADVYDISSVSVTDEAQSINYEVLIVTPAAFTITPKHASVTASPVTVTFRGSEFTAEELKLSYLTEGFINGDENALSGFLKTDKSVLEAGTYAIVADIAFEHKNYVVSFVPGSVTVQKAPITITSYVVLDEAEFDYDPAAEYIDASNFAYKVTSGTVFDGYELAGSLGNAPMQAGLDQQIPQGTLTDALNPNYAITYVAGVFSVNYIRLVITPEPVKQVYGEADISIPFSVTREDDGSVFGLEIQGALSYEKAMSLHSPVGEYVVTLGNLADENPNYQFTLSATDVKYEIIARPVSVIPADVTAVYGDALKDLTYSLGGEYGLATGDALDITLAKAEGAGVRTYAVTVVNDYAIDNPNYDITVSEGVYEITRRPVTIALRDQSAEFAMSGVYTVDQTAYDIVAGTVVGGDDLGVVISKETGSAMGFYELTAFAENANYDVTFETALFEIRKYTAVIETGSRDIVLVYSGNPYSISASATSGADVSLSYTINGMTYNGNAFTEVGRYVVTLSAPETEYFYAPEDVTVYITINQDFLSADESGIEVIVNNNEGFAPEVELGLEKLPQDDKDLNDVLSSSETVVRAFNITAIADGDLASFGESPSVTVKVPGALAEQDAVKVLVKENGAYSVRILNVSENGYVTIDNVSDISAFAFVKEEARVNWLLIILLGGAALIITITATVFLLRKRY